MPLKDAESVKLRNSIGFIDSENPIQVQIGDGTNQADIIPANGHFGLVAIAPGHVSTKNSIGDPDFLLADEVFTGEWEDITNFGVIVVSVTADVTSAINGLMVEFSTDGDADGLVTEDKYTINAGAKKTFSFQAAAKFYRIVYTNGSVDQTHFHLQTILKPYYVKPSSHRISDTISSEDDAELITNVNKGRSDLTNDFENINSFRGALNVNQALVHKVGISEHVRRDLAASTTLDVAASAGDILINVADTSGFAVDDLVTVHNTIIVERSHFHIIAVVPGVSITLNRPIDNDFEVGDTIQQVDIGMNVVGNIADPISFRIQPPISERWQITRLMTTMLASTSMDDAKFGGITALQNGTVVRLNIDGQYQTLTHWKSNADMKDDMYNVDYSDKAPAGQFGLSGRWTFTKAQFIADLDGANGDFLEVLIQDDLTGLDDFEIKAQGRLFGG